MYTKTVDKISINKDIIIEKMKEEVKEEILDAQKVLMPEISKFLKNRWVYMANKDVVYDNEIVAIYPDLNKYECIWISTISCKLTDINKKSLTFYGYSGDLMSSKEISKAFRKDINFPFKTGGCIIKNFSKETVDLACKKNKLVATNWEISNLDFYDNEEPGLLIPIYRLNGENSPKVKDSKVLFYFIKNGLIPQGLNKEAYKVMEYLVDMSKYIEYNSNSICFNQELFLNDSKENKINHDFSANKIEDILLNGDKYRADIDSYDKKMLYDPNRGHWDLWDNKNNNNNNIDVNIDIPLVARNPKADIRDGGLIGIDFGTKSTVVVFQKDSEHTLPMRIGMGHYSKKTDAKQYENPTVMEFINIDNFIHDYNSSDGRPNTSWQDLTVSHTAFNSLINSSSEHYYSVFSELKQWAGDKKSRLRLRDKNKVEKDLPPFLDLKDNDINPIELYAYYIGLYINNHINGIFMDYHLSFPVTYEKEVREKILMSFEKGLRKSLPETLINDSEVMKNFRVIAGASEPAAYAICALQEYGFEPEGDEKFFYGIFDFGGGTTDFDFGIWKEASGRDSDRFDYVIEHFGTGGDRYLGGENLLLLLSFEVFKDNQDKLRENKLSFVKPPECKEFPGCEALIKDSQEAKLNTKQLMEKLRPFWEKHQDFEKEFSNGILKVNLFDNDGVQKPNFELKIKQEMLEEIVTKRIEKGVRNFFESLRLAFQNPSLDQIDKVNIFLAGNASKSAIVKSLFEKYIQTETEAIKKLQGTDSKFFELFPALGTEEASEKQKQLGLEETKDEIKPTGKTGVAFGLIKSRKGGKIKVIDRNLNETNETKFKYYLGTSKKGKFRAIVNRDIDYNEWKRFISADIEDLEIYYTDLPEATNNDFDISKALRKKIRLESTDLISDVYLRAVKPTVIEYVVATEKEISSQNLKNKIFSIDLG